MQKDNQKTVSQRKVAPSTADPPTIDAEALVERAKDGDTSAFGELVSEFEQFVFNTACRVLISSGLSTDSAEDIAQDSFIKAWRNLDSFRGDCSFSTWLFRITVNTARDSIRSASRRAAISLTRAADDDVDGEEWDIPVTSGDTIPEESAERKEQITAVRRAIEALPDEQKQVIVMRDIHELSYQTIADALGLELGTVKSRINRGRAALKELLSKSGLF